jgi:hypothetical protein
LTELAYSTVERDLRRQHFAVLATADATGRPASAGVTYGIAPSGAVIYVMTRRHLQKARNIDTNADVSLVVPVPRLLLLPVPPATIQLRGRAETLDWTHPGGREVFGSFWLGRRIVKSYEQLHARGDSRVCFLRIELDPVIHTYLVGTGIWRVRSRMEAGAATVRRA